MIISKKVKLKRFGNKNLNHYRNLGYNVEDKEFEINIEHLTPGSNVIVEAECDFCHRITNIKYSLYLKNISSHNLFACSSKCAVNKTKMTNLENLGVEYVNQSSEIRSKTISTNLERWGFDSPTKSEEVKEKIRKTNLEKWGVEYFLQSVELREKWKKSLIEKWGVDHNFKIPQVREKSKQTLIKNWGVDNPSKSPQINEKKKKTSIKNWGVEYPIQSEEIQKKIKENNLLKYGVEWPFQSSDIREKSKESLRRKWSVEHNSQIEIVKESMKKNNLKNWGVEYTLQSLDIRKNIQNTNLEKYGTTCALKNDEVRIKYFKISQDPNYLRYVDESISILWCNENNHEFEISSSNYHSRIRLNSNLCTICYPVESSKSIKEVEIYDFILSQYKGRIESNYKEHYEIDIYLPELNIGFEFNGLYWHSDEFRNKNYHLEKSLYFKDRGISIFHIWEDDWDNKKEILKSQIKNLLKLSNKIPARKCKLKEVDTTSAKDFLNKNHILGADKSQKKIGLYFDDELVCLMTFNKLEGRKKLGECEWNISRFCNKLGFIIVGGASKILSWFIKNINVRRLISYADRNFSEGDLYKKLDFNQIKITNPDYSYLINGKRVHKQNFKKSKLNIENLTESEFMKSKGIKRIWDCGKIKYERLIY